MKGKNVVRFLAPICQQKDHKSNQDQQRQKKKKIRFVINKISFSFCYSMSNTVFENYREKSYSTLRAKRATVTFWVDKSLLKMPKMPKIANIGEY